ncbi:MAG: group 1 truncated hemoglobin [Myxococcales bacterium]|nr:group 1 truncated hemoglobin [Myxococcales bacterium]
MKLYEELGEARLRAIIDRFVDRVADDVMIGFFFKNVDRARLKQREYEHAARHLGADVPYTGRPLDVAHAPHPIMGGQFMRRLVLLKTTLEEHAVPAHIIEHWITHTERLRPLVTRDTDGECHPGVAAERVREHYASLGLEKKETS